MERFSVCSLFRPYEEQKDRNALHLLTHPPTEIRQPEEKAVGKAHKYTTLYEI